MSPFAKLFETEDLGQILAIADTSEQTGLPCVRLTFKSQRPQFGLCSTEVRFHDTPKGWADRDGLFDKIDGETVVAALVAGFGEKLSVLMEIQK